jgi:uncharacterized protein (TIGR02246 family)
MWDEDHYNPADVASIRALISRDYQGAMNRMDASGYSALFTEDVVWAPPGAPVVTDRASIRAEMEKLFADHEVHVEVTPEEVEVRRDFACVLGRIEGESRPRAEGESRPIRSTAMWLLRKRADGWRISRQVWNER